jgi:hypothetical protein
MQPVLLKNAACAAKLIIKDFVYYVVVMDKEEILFNKIADSLATGHDVSKGKMMSAQGIKYKNKFFVFYYKKEMVFRLGSNFDPKQYNLKECYLFRPFKNKGPMKNWFQIPYSEKLRWEKLAKAALNVLKEESSSLQ